MKKSKKIHFFKGCGEKMAITRLILRLAPQNHVHSIENKIFVKIKLERDTGLQIRAELDFSSNLGQNSRLFFNFLA